MLAGDLYRTYSMFSVILNVGLKIDPFQHQIVSIPTAALVTPLFYMTELV